jgi:hypothetical protein
MDGIDGRGDGDRSGCHSPAPPGAPTEERMPPLPGQLGEGESIAVSALPLALRQLGVSCSAEELQHVLRTLGLQDDGSISGGDL